MAGFSQEALDAEMANIGRPKELIGQIEAQERCEQVIADLEGTAIGPSGLFSVVEEKVESVTEQVELSDDCNINFSPNLISMVSLMMTAISNPEGARLAGLQLLMNTLKIKPPGFNLPSFDLDLDLPNISLPNISLPSLDFGLSSGGGFDMGSMLKGVAGLLAIPPIGGCGVLLPDIAKEAKDLIPETGLPEGETGGLANPPKTLGNDFVKQGFDKDGNPYQIAFRLGAPAKIAQSAPRVESPPATLGTFAPQEYAVGGLREGGLFTEEILDAGLGTASPGDVTGGGGLQSNTNKIKPPIYESVNTGLGQSTIIEKNNDPVFSELVKQKIKTGLGTTVNQSEFGPAYSEGSEFDASLNLYGSNYGRAPTIDIEGSNEGSVISHYDEKLGRFVEPVGPGVESGVNRIGIPEGDGPPRTGIDIEIFLNPDNE